jgi:hypothetical protein
MAIIFGDFDTTRFWDDCEYAAKHYVENPPTDELIIELESQLGYNIPRSYVELAKTQNGGSPNNTCCPTDCPTSWAEDHIAITGIYSIGKLAHYSLGGSMNSQFWIDEWGYPPIGIYFADCPSAGHDMIALDYRDCGRLGEPCVVHVDQECGYQITKIADTFEQFIRKLQPDDNFNDDEVTLDPEQVKSVWVDPEFKAKLERGEL